MISIFYCGDTLLSWKIMQIDTLNKAVSYGAGYDGCELKR